jgi:hypothetical protein
MVMVVHVRMHDCARVQARNIDEVMDAHDRYLGTILSKAMLDSHTEALRGILNSMFDCCQRSVLPLRDTEAQIAAKAALLQQVSGPGRHPHPRLLSAPSYSVD